MAEQDWTFDPRRWEVSNDDYHADVRAESSSTIRDFLTSEKLYRCKYVDRTIKSKAAKHFVLGNLVHEMLLEGHELTNVRYVMIPREIDTMDKRTKKYKEAYAEWSAVQPNLPHVAPDVWETAHAMERAVYSHPIAREILEGSVETELGMKWIDAASEIPLKVRLDMLSRWQGGPTTVEFKSSRRPTEFSRDVFDHGYHIQAALYHDATVNFDDPVMQECFGSSWPDARHVFIVVDNQAPYQCEVYETPREILNLGWVDVRHALDRMAEVRTSGKYRDTETGSKPGTIRAPKWFTPRAHRVEA